jgi:predicted lipoprotein with Yx(FWY)xxD motif
MKGNIMRSATNLKSGSLFATLLIGSLLSGYSSMAMSSDAAPAKMENGALVGPNGMTLYVFDKDTGGKSMCNGKCAENWPPFMAKGDASGDFSVITRDDGSKQYAYKGKPLYYWSKDKMPGDKAGEGFNNVWHVAK